MNEKILKQQQMIDEFKAERNRQKQVEHIKTVVNVTRDAIAALGDNIKYGDLGVNEHTVPMLHCPGHYPIELQLMRYRDIIDISFYFNGRRYDFLADAMVAAEKKKSHKVALIVILTMLGVGLFGIISFCIRHW